MEARKFFVAFIMMLVFETGFAQETSKKALREQRKTEKQQLIESLINSNDFVFEALQVLPQRGKMIILTGSSYTLKFHNDTIESYLPFFGRAYSVDYGGDGGIKFKGKPDDYKVVTQKAGKGWEINASVKAPKDYYKLYLSVSPDGGATLVIDSNQRSSISYRGDIKKLEEAK